ncbi:hypothetical protein Lal_00031840 [Lupinus albus]|nr:hypothetical protein Lal_00031840 [Lupinus albus]
MGVNGSPPPTGLSHYSYDSQWHFAVVKGNYGWPKPLQPRGLGNDATLRPQHNTNGSRELRN